MSDNSAKRDEFIRKFLKDNDISAIDLIKHIHGFITCLPMVAKQSGVTEEWKKMVSFLFDAAVLIKKDFHTQTNDVQYIGTCFIVVDMLSRGMVDYLGLHAGDDD